MIVVTISEARLLQKQGRPVPNPNYRKAGHADEKLPFLFRADNLIHWRPDETLPEEKQFATSTAV